MLLYFSLPSRNFTKGSLSPFSSIGNRFFPSTKTTFTTESHIWIFCFRFTGPAMTDESCELPNFRGLILFVKYCNGIQIQCYVLYREKKLLKKIVLAVSPYSFLEDQKLVQKLNRNPEGCSIRVQGTLRPSDKGFDTSPSGSFTESNHHLSRSVGFCQQIVET